MDWIGKPLGLPYVPITPTFPALGPLGAIPLPSKWWIDFAPPVATARHGAKGADDPILVTRLSEEIRATVQRAVNARLAKRESVWLG